jgi:hypothetical protein
VFDPQDTKGAIMAKKFNVTRKDALNQIIVFARENGYDNADVLEVVDNMLSKLQTATKNTGETAAHRQNAQLLEKNLHLFEGEDVALTAREFATTAKDFPVDNTGRPSVHKATAILVQGINDGILTKVAPEKKSHPMRYALKKD